VAETTGARAPEIRGHFLCTACGAIEDLRAIEVNVVAARVPRALRDHEVDVAVHGECDDCREPA
jgi:Fe2+ or Zn2+ uptake regulation protein